METTGPLPRRASVRPRVRAAGSDLALLLEDEIADLLAARDQVEVLLIGSPGSGRQTALSHLAYVFGGEKRLQFAQRERDAGEASAQARGEVLIRVGSGSAQDDPPAVALAGKTAGTSTTRRVVQFVLQPWSDDDVLEYLLDQHREHVGRVLAIWQADTSHDLHRWPTACTAVLDQLAIRPELDSVRQTLPIVLALAISERDYGDAVAFAVTRTFTNWSRVDPQVGAIDQAKQIQHRHAMLGSATVLGTLAAQWVVEVAKLQPPGQPRVLPWDRATRDALAHTMRTDQETANALERIAQNPRLRHKAFVFGALGLKQAGYRPPRAPRGDLRWAWLRGVDLSGQCIKARLDFANLSHAILTACTFERTSMANADLSGARADAACFAHLKASELTAVDIQSKDSDWSGVALQDARLQNACFDNASFERAGLKDTDLRGASLHGALLTGASIVRVTLDGADLSHANCHRMRANHVDLRTTNLDSTNLEACRLTSCNFEGTRQPNLRAVDATFIRCDLTATQWLGADLQRAKFAECGLAHVDWQGADLRGADFRTATFHLGNARSGLVDSLVAGEGSRTGFYTDESLEERFQTPEDVRKANLRDCDLRGAVVEGTDFYLVDLRGAQMTAAQRQWMMRCRAILDPAGTGS